VVPARDGHVPPNALDEVHAEFLTGPAVRTTMAAWTPGEDGDAATRCAAAPPSAATAWPRPARGSPRPGARRRRSPPP
jgi:hypothetical protein